MSNKAYIGDSVFVEFYNNKLTLTTENGYGPTNTIVLEDEVYSALLKYVDRILEKPATGIIGIDK